MKQVSGTDMKSVGQVELDLADFCSEKEQTRPLTLKLHKCTDKKAFLVCTIRSKWLKQISGDKSETRAHARTWSRLAWPLSSPASVCCALAVQR